LPPVGASLITALLHQTIAGKLLALFHKTILVKQNRSVDCFHTKMIARINNQIDQHPITKELLQDICYQCKSAHDPKKRLPDPIDHLPSDLNCPNICPHRCQHFKVLSHEDIAQDKLWSRATTKLVTCLHSSGKIYII
jgi:hypothetical protein